ncbi:MAG: SDR family NAD(P)-dependent oxidoreductase [Pyrinomonadaceae bacterium]|nr:SDR family NAD(P)-dependent oxidoreductase [Pyrinomonadaceae bacterium]
MKVLVTGATGFVGREIIAVLAESNIDLIAVGGKHSSSINQELPRKDNQPEFLSVDITDENSLAELEKVGKVDAVIHSAGLAHQFGDTKKEEFEAVNGRGTKNVLELAIKLGAQHFILIGSTAVYGVTPTGKTRKTAGKTIEINEIAIDEECATNPANFYAESKLEAERICRRLCEENNLPLTIFRLAPVIGEANVGNVARLIEAIDKKRFLWIGDGKNLKTVIYKRDVALACLKLLHAKAPATEIFNLAGAPISMKEFVGEIARRLERRVFGFKIPVGLPRLVFRLNDGFFKLQKISKLGATIEKWLADDVYSAEKIKRRYGFTPATSVREALEKQVRRYREQAAESGAGK